MEDLHVLYGDISKALQDQSVEVLDYVWLLVAEVIKAIDCLNLWVWLWKEVIGNFNVLHEERGLMDMSSKLTMNSTLLVTWTKCHSGWISGRTTMCAISCILARN